MQNTRINLDRYGPLPIFAGPGGPAGRSDVAGAINEIRVGLEDFMDYQNERMESIERRVDDLAAAGNRPGLGGGALDRTGAVQAFCGTVRDITGRHVADDAADLESYRAAFRDYLRRGEKGAGPEIMASMSVGSDPAGGYLVVPEMGTEIVRRLFESSPIRSIARVRTISSDAFEQPVDTSEIGFGWVGEQDARTETTSPTLTLQRVSAHEMYAEPRLTQKIVEDSGIDLEDYVTERIVDRFGRAEAAAFVTGDGVAKPRGFLDYKADAVTTDDDTRAWGVLQYVPTGAAGGFPSVSGSTAADPDALFTLVYKLKAPYRANAVWVMNRSTAAAIRKLKDADGRYLWRDALDAGQPDRLLGYPVVLAEDMPDISSDSFSVAFGDFMRGYLIVDRRGISVLRDPYTTKGYIKLYTRKRVGGDVWDFDAIKLLKFASS